MAECNAELAGEFVQVCGHKPKQGVLGKWYLNYKDIDREATQLANRNTKVLLLVLKAGAKLYKAGGNDKAHKVEHALAVGDFGNGYIHTDRYTITYNGENEMERIQEIVDGARLVSIEEMVDGGIAGELSFKIAGFESGMVITEDNFNSAENNGTVNIALATKEGEEEATGLKLFLLAGGVEATRTWINTNTYVAPVPEP